MLQIVLLIMSPMFTPPTYLHTKHPKIVIPGIARHTWRDSIHLLQVIFQTPKIGSPLPVTKYPMLTTYPLRCIAWSCRCHFYFTLNVMQLCTINFNTRNVQFSLFLQFKINSFSFLVCLFHKCVCVCVCVLVLCVLIVFLPHFFCVEMKSIRIILL